MSNLKSSITYITLGSLLIALVLTGGLVSYYSRDAGVDVPKTFRMKFYPLKEEIWNTSPFTYYLDLPSDSDSSSEQSAPPKVVKDTIPSTSSTTLPPTTTTTISPSTSTTTTSTTVPYVSPLSKAQREIGSLEGEDDYSVGGFWCYRFVAWTLGWQEHVAEAAWADLSQRLVAVPPSEAQPGDVVAINLMPEHSAPDQVSHTGLIESIDSDGRMITIEGNTLNEEGVPSVNKVERRVDDEGVIGIYRVS